MEFNIADIYESLVDVIPDRKAVVAGDRELTYAELDARANQLGHFLQTQGVGHGDHVGLHLYNGAQFVEAMLAIFKIRAVPININYRYVADELNYLFDDADLKGLIFQREFGPQVVAGSVGVDRLTLFVALEDGSAGDISGLDAVMYEAALESGSTDRDFEPRSADDLYIIYTGGTTGMPRGVMWRQGDLFFAGLQGGNPGDDPVERPEEVAQLVADGRDTLNIHSAAPLIHGAAQFGTWITFWTGGTTALVIGRSFSPAETCELVGRTGINVVNLVGDAMARPLAEEILNNPGKYDLESLFCVSSAGAILSRSVKEDLKRALPDRMIMNNFGSSETGHQGTALDTDSGDEGDDKRPRFFMHGEGSVVIDENHNFVEPGSGVIGKIARTGHIPLGYYNAPEKTAATFVTINGTRYVIPGDMALVEEDGLITLLGRGSICINTGGEKVFPEEVEEAFKAHPAVMDVVVIGLPDDRWGERVTALILLREGVRASLAELSEHCRSKVAGYKSPREIFLVEHIQRHPSGKPEYAWAKERAAELSAANV